MSTYFYSASTRGFYTKEIHGDNMPSDVVGVDEEYWRGLFVAQSQGMEIRPDADGRPVAVHPGAS